MVSAVCGKFSLLVANRLVNDLPTVVKICVAAGASAASTTATGGATAAEGADTKGADAEGAGAEGARAGIEPGIGIGRPIG